MRYYFHNSAGHKVGAVAEFSGSGLPPGIYRVAGIDTRHGRAGELLELEPASRGRRTWHHLRRAGAWLRRFILGA